jgi:type II secretory pathway pseudopilin PulG
VLHQGFQGYLPSGMSPSQYPASPQTYSNTQAYSSQSGVTPADLSISQTLTSPAAIASLAQITSAELPVSKSVLNALAVDYEEKIFDLSEMVEGMAPLVEQGYNLKALFTPEGFPSLSEVFLDTLASVPGAYDYFLENGFAQLSEAFAAPAREQQAQQQAAYQQQMQQQAQQQQQYNPQAQQTGTYWPDGSNPLDRNDLRPGFPGMPNPASQQQGAPQVDLEGLSPNQAFLTIDTISGMGGFRGTTFAAE